MKYISVVGLCERDRGKQGGFLENVILDRLLQILFLKGRD